jgi:DNA-binding MarR family transcriptional regulator
MQIFFGETRRGRRPIHASNEWADDRLIASLVDYERRARAVRTEIFDANVINESSWPLLQDLFAAHMAGVKMRTKELCATSGLPQTTVLRYLDHLERFEVIRREQDADDQRVTLVAVTDSGAFWMREYYTEVVKTEQAMAENSEGLFSLSAKCDDQIGRRKDKPAESS